MSRTQWILSTVLVAELAVGAVLAVGRMSQRPTPPVPDLATVDPLTADEIWAKIALCQTPEQWAELGEIYLAAGFFPEAEATLREAATLAPGSADIAFKHGFALERLGELEEANASYQTAIRLNHPREADLWYYVGKNHLRLEQAATAEASFKRAGNLPGARYELALLNARAGQLAQADAEARRLADEFQTSYPPIALRYRLALVRQDSSAADTLADQFARRPRPLPTPFDTEVDWVFGIANGLGQSRLFRDAGREMQAGRAARAETELRSALAAGWNPEIAEKLADVLLALGRWRDATEVLTETIARAGPSPARLWRLGQAHDAAGQTAKAQEAWERAARFATGSTAEGLWNDLTTHYQRNGDMDRAKGYRALSFLAAGMQRMHAGKPADAIQPLKQAVETDPELAHAWYYLGEAHRATGRPADARAAYQRCLQIDPDHGRASRARKLFDE